MSARSLLRASAGVTASAILALLVLLGASPTPAGAVEPPLLEGDRIAQEEAETSPPATPLPRMPRILPAQPAPQPAADPAPTSSPQPRPTASPEPGSAVPGYDISYPQCGGPYPEEFGFAIVGVNGGRVYSPNPCLGTGNGPSQLEWAGPDAQLYVNTGNPGPRLSRFWPTGQEEPRSCAAGEPDTFECAYVYGWNAALYAHAVALDAFVDLEWADPDADALPGPVTWWLDVEDANSWRRDSDRNVAALRGMVDALESLGAAEIGFYSTPRLWNRITGGTDAFQDHPAWHAGARDANDATERCGGDAFTGGELRMVQWVEGGFDANVRCPGEAGLEPDVRDR